MVKSFAAGVAVLCVAMALAFPSHDAFAAGGDGPSDDAMGRDPKNRLPPATEKMPVGNTWDFAAPGQGIDTSNAERDFHMSPETNASVTTSADRVMCAICLLMTLSGLIVVIVWWARRQRSAASRNVGHATERHRLLNLSFTHEEPFTESGQE